MRVIIVAFFCFFMMTGCKKDNKDLSLPVLKLSSDFLTGKSQKKIEVTVDITAPDGFNTLVISKAINLKTDSAYGVNGVQSVTPQSTGTNTYRYTFSYVLSPDEVDKLVGFNYKLTDKRGRQVEKDLTVNTVASAAQNIFQHTWALTSKLWTSVSPATETIKDCEKDDRYQWHRDSTIAITYGTSACTFDGFNVYDKWTLSDDEKVFTQIYHSVFDPTAITVEKYNVQSITKDRIVMSILVDLSPFGPPYTDHEVFVYTFDAVQ